MTRTRRLLTITGAAVLCAVLGASLAACTPGVPGDGASSSRPSSPAPVPSASYDDAIVPDVAGALDEDSAGTEAVRLADAIQGLIPASSIVYVDDHAQYVDATKDSAAYYGVIRTITLEGGADATAISASIIASLEASGWTQSQATDQNGLALTALVSSLDPAAWFVLVGGDATGTQPVVSLQLASPDLT
ncbi:hypothetical protein QT381_12385 [Galbitalea sp. SE-J8]|uniref:hypothetical protein n=1 Tax=Galbitalea sp. SE-J8 TaxID=3054952 RepID=UPI00259CDAF1|nr:hypothetical protein [Galbitalea sp. SE-J8]MDM4763805.1 hypothetical protein [Galbitalea sp. SE-J8]